MKKERIKARLADLVLNSGQLVWLPANPRQWRQEDINKTKKSLQTDPDFLEEHPLLVVQHGKKLVVFAGNLRTTAAKELKWETIEAVLYTPETEEDKTTILRRSLLDNGQFGSWDYDALANEWHEFQLADFGIPAWDAAKDEEESPQQVEEDDFNEETDAVETRCKAGDIWQLGGHRLMCGDSTSEADVAKLMDGAAADVVLTDPPYGMGLDTDYSTMKNHLDFAKEKGFKGGKKYDAGRVDEFHPEMVQAALNLGAKEVFLWGADFYAELLPARNEGSWIVWDKRANNTGDIEADESSDKMYGSCFELCWSKCKHKRDIARIKWAGVFGTEQEFDHKRYHPTQKPVNLSGWFISRYSKQGDIIVDLFGGSGSTLMAAEQLGRKCYMAEIDPHYCDVILTRWERLTGEKAVKIQ